jgi:hypothetical protein
MSKRHANACIALFEAKGGRIPARTDQDEIKNDW